MLPSFQQQINSGQTRNISISHISFPISHFVIEYKEREQAALPDPETFNDEPRIQS